MKNVHELRATQNLYVKFLVTKMINVETSLQDNLYL